MVSEEFTYDLFWPLFEISDFSIKLHWNGMEKETQHFPAATLSPETLHVICQMQQQLRFYDVFWFDFQQLCINNNVLLVSGCSFKCRSMFLFWTHWNQIFTWQHERFLCLFCFSTFSVVWCRYGLNHTACWGTVDLLSILWLGNVHIASKNLHNIGEYSNIYLYLARQGKATLFVWHISYTMV